MGWNGFSRRTCRDLVRGLLLVGLSSALAVWFTASGAGPDPLGDPLADSKVYRRSLEMYGGSANVMASEFMDGFKQLWHGRPLAGTLVVLTLAAVLAVFLLRAPGEPGSRRD
jgi:hypothetical protein